MKRSAFLLSLVLLVQNLSAQTKDTTVLSREVGRDTVANMVIVKRCGIDDRSTYWDVYFENFSHDYVIKAKNRFFRDSIRRFLPRDTDIYDAIRPYEYVCNVASNYIARRVKEGGDAERVFSDTTVISRDKLYNLSPVFILKLTLDRHSHLRHLGVIYWYKEGMEDTIDAADIARLAYAFDTRVDFGDWVSHISGHARFSILYASWYFPMICLYSYRDDEREEIQRRCLQVPGRSRDMIISDIP